LHAAVDIPSGVKLRSSMIQVLRPAGGIEPWQLQDTLGRHTIRRIAAGDQITADCFYG
jgi:sialic acid synthase SpsE